MDPGDIDICKAVALDGVIVTLTKGHLRSEAILRAAHVSLLSAEAPIVREGLERGGITVGVDVVEVIHGTVQNALGDWRMRSRVSSVG